jgi:hypothetical protein
MSGAKGQQQQGPSAEMQAFIEREQHLATVRGAWAASRARSRARRPPARGAERGSEPRARRGPVRRARVPCSGRRARCAPSRGAPLPRSHSPVAACSFLPKGPADDRDAHGWAHGRGPGAWGRRRCTGVLAAPLCGCVLGRRAACSVSVLCCRVLRGTPAGCCCVPSEHVSARTPASAARARVATQKGRARPPG